MVKLVAKLSCILVAREFLKLEAYYPFFEHALSVDYHAKEWFIMPCKSSFIEELKSEPLIEINVPFNYLEDPKIILHTNILNIVLI